MLQRLKHIPRGTAGTVLLVSLCCLAAWSHLVEYLQLDLALIICLIAAPLVFKINHPQKQSLRSAILAISFLLLFSFLKMQVWFLMAVGATLILIIESRHGKMGILPWILLFLLTPMLKFLVEVFTFPIRLKMSQLAAETLQFTGYPITVSGNLFTVGEHTFSVDQACIGLNTIITGLVLTVLLIAQRERQARRILPLWALATLFIVATCLLISGNFVRIVMLALFQSPPETFSHDMIGLLTLLMYLIVPIYFLIRLCVQKFGLRKDKQTFATSEKLGFFPQQNILISLFLIGTIAYFSLNRTDYRSLGDPGELKTEHIPGMKKSIVKGSIAKFEGPELLVYIKPPRPFWRVNHVPTTCWQGSGYQFHHIRTEGIGNHIIYIGELLKNKEKLYTAWWYDNGKVITHSQWEWRWLNLGGEAPFKLVNVTSTEFDLLRKACTNLLSPE